VNNKNKNANERKKHTVTVFVAHHSITVKRPCGLGKFCDFRLKWPFISQTVQDMLVSVRMQFPPSESDDDEDTFFSTKRRPHVNVQDVVANYLHDASDTLASLDVWPSLKPMFIKLTTKFKFFSLLSAPATVIL